MLWFLSSSIRYLTSNDEEEDEENGEHQKIQIGFEGELTLRIQESYFVNGS
jgi:hypothetical protein